LNHQTIANEIQNNDQLISKFMEECLRLETTSRVQRITTQSINLAGVELPAGTKLIFNLQSANTDAAQFEDPFSFSINRPKKYNISFGHGIHQCIGLAMARGLGLSTLQVLIERLNELNLYIPQKPVYSFANFNDNIISILVTKTKWQFSAN
jgi:cytochrome P450